MSLILKVYMQLYTLGYDYDTTTWAKVNETWGRIDRLMPNWDELEKWMFQVRSEVLASIPDQRDSFEGQVRVAEELQHRYGRWQDQDCLMVKAALMKYATPGTGRVNLTTFKTAELPGGWKVSESIGYLREMGALDESNPQNPSVVVPKYFDTPSNCARTSKYYQVCCISECEALLGHLERKLGSPHASPAQIVELVEHLPSGTIEVPRTLPPSLIKRLQSVAAFHGGDAPLHGRLFRQWMHHAFPFECSFPSLSPAAAKMAASKPAATTKKPGGMVRRQARASQLWSAMPS